ncbi:MAG: TrkA family potassium uptake protein [Caldisericia bacterium]
MNLIVIGCGRVGSMLATLMSADGHNVTVIDRDSDSFKKLPMVFTGTKIVGIEFESKVLKEAGVDTCDAVAVVTESDNINIMVAETIRNLFENKWVVARLYDPRKKKTYERLNLRSVCPTTLGAYQMYAEILSFKLGSKLPLNNGDFELIELSQEKVNFTETSDIIKFEKKYGSKIVGIRTKSKLLFPWIEGFPDNIRSWIVMAPTLRLRKIVDVFQEVG